MLSDHTSPARLMPRPSDGPSTFTSEEPWDPHMDVDPEEDGNERPPPLLDNGAATSQ
jgi:hypothetical protein